VIQRVHTYRRCYWLTSCGLHATAELGGGAGCALGLRSGVLLRKGRGARRCGWFLGARHWVYSV
jgi:hypothetical protein